MHQTPGQVLQCASRCVRRLLEAGLPLEALQKPIDDPEMRRRLVEFWISGDSKPRLRESPADRILNRMNPAWRRASEIMGQNFFGIAEAAKYFGVDPTMQDLDTLSRIPFSEEMLEECKDTHILIAVFPLSILEIRSRVEHELFYSHENSWYAKNPLGKEYGEAEWQLVRKTPAPRSGGNYKWDQRLRCLSENEVVPSARVMVYTIVGHFLATENYLFRNIFVSCSDIGSSYDKFIAIGYFDYETRRGELQILYGDPSEYSQKKIGQAAALLPDNV